jgi:hypothetical protein
MSGTPAPSLGPLCPKREGGISFEGGNKKPHGVICAFCAKRHGKNIPYCRCDFFSFGSSSVLHLQMDDHLEELRKCLWDASAMVHALLAGRAMSDAGPSSETLAQLRWQLMEANRLHGLLM